MEISGKIFKRSGTQRDLFREVLKSSNFEMRRQTSKGTKYQKRFIIKIAEFRDSHRQIGSLVYFLSVEKLLDVSVACPAINNLKVNLFESLMEKSLSKGNF